MRNADEVAVSGADETVVNSADEAAVSGGDNAAVSDSGRGRSWLIAGLAFALVCVYLLVWAAYSGGHTYPRYEQLAPGATGKYEMNIYRVVSLEATPVVIDSYGDPHQADANEVWVVAVMQVTIDRSKEYVACSPKLMGPGGRVWEAPIDAPQRKISQFCDDATPGVPYTFELLFRIPSRYAHQLRGLVLVNDGSAAPSQVLTPAR